VGAGNLTMEQVLKEAWRLTKGFKGMAWASMIVVGLITGVASAILGFATVSPSEYQMAGDFVMQYVTSAWQGLVLLPLSAPLQAGVLMLAVRRIQGHDTEFGSVFSYFPKMLPLTLAGVIVALITYAGLALLIIPGIFLSTCLMFVQILVVDRNIGPIEAVKLSLSVVKGRFWHVFGTMFVAGCFVLLSVLPLGIGLIWSLPWMYLVMAVMYRSLFGVQSIPFLTSYPPPYGPPVYGPGQGFGPPPGHYQPRS
jgi:hypothetical protein